MQAFASNIDYFLAVGAIGLQLVTIALIGVFALRGRNQLAAEIAETVTERALLVAFLVSLFSTLMTLVYSDLFGIEPCPLCWWQRVFLYPQVILFGMALWKRDAYVAEYSIVMSVFGFGIALYQHLLQMLPGSGLPCPATTVSCAQRFFFEFNYVTYPLLAVTLFAFLIVLMLFVRAQRTE